MGMRANGSRLRSGTAGVLKHPGLGGVRCATPASQRRGRNHADEEEAGGGEGGVPGGGGEGVLGQGGHLGGCGLFGPLRNDRTGWRLHRSDQGFGLRVRDAVLGETGVELGSEDAEEDRAEDRDPER